MNTQLTELLWIISSYKHPIALYATEFHPSYIIYILKVIQFLIFSPLLFSHGNNSQIFSISKFH